MLLEINSLGLREISTGASKHAAKASLSNAALKNFALVENELVEKNFETLKEIWMKHLNQLKFKNSRQILLILDEIERKSHDRDVGPIVNAANQLATLLNVPLSWETTPTKRGGQFTSTISFGSLRASGKHKKKSYSKGRAVIKLAQKLKEIYVDPNLSKGNAAASNVSVVISEPKISSSSLSTSSSPEPTSYNGKKGSVALGSNSTRAALEEKQITAESLGSFSNLNGQGGLPGFPFKGIPQECRTFGPKPQPGKPNLLDPQVFDRTAMTMAATSIISGISSANPGNGVSLNSGTSGAYVASRLEYSPNPLSSLVNDAKPIVELSPNILNSLEIIRSSMVSSQFYFDANQILNFTCDCIIKIYPKIRFGEKGSWRTQTMRYYKKEIDMNLFVVNEPSFTTIHFISTWNSVMALSAKATASIGDFGTIIIKATSQIDNLEANYLVDQKNSMSSLSLKLYPIYDLKTENLIFENEVYWEPMIKMLQENDTLRLFVAYSRQWRYKNTQFSFK